MSHERFDLKNFTCFIDRGTLHLLSCEGKKISGDPKTGNYVISGRVEGCEFEGQGKNRSEAERVFVDAVKQRFRD